MLKKTIIYLSLFAIISFSGDSYLKYCIAQQNKHESPYRLAFASVGANLLESRLDCWATIKIDGSQNQLNQVLTQLIQHLNLPTETDKILHEENKDITTLQYNLVLGNMGYCFLLQSNQTKDRIYILITVTGEEENVYWYESKLRQLYDCTVYYQYRGIIDAQATLIGQEELLSILLTNLNATVKSSYRENSMSSLTGYSSSIPIRPVSVDRESVNLQAAMRSNSDGKIEVYLGMPFLLCDY